MMDIVPASYGMVLPAFTHFPLPFITSCVSNVGIASILSDPFGKTATDIISYLLEHTADSVDEKAVRKLIKKGA